MATPQAAAAPTQRVGSSESHSPRDSRCASGRSRRASDRGLLPMTLESYLTLLDWTGRQLRAGTHGVIPPALLPGTGECRFRSAHTSRKLFSDIGRRRLRSPEFFARSTRTMITLKISPKKNHNHAFRLVFCAHKAQKAPNRNSTPPSELWD